MRAYHRNPSLQPIVEFVFLPIICFEDELIVELRKGDAGVAVEFFWILREAGQRWGGRIAGRLEARHILCANCRNVGILACGAVGP